EQLADLLGDVIKPIQITEEVAEGIGNALRESDAESERLQRESRDRLDQRRRVVVSKLDRGYDDYAESRISEEFWARKSKEWEAELRMVDRELERSERSGAPITATASKILELAKQAENLYKSQNPAEQRRLLETVL